MAGSAIDFSGYYKAYYYAPNNVTHNTNGFSPDWHDSDEFFMNRLNVDVTFRPTDEISVFWQLRGPDKVRWGGTRLKDPRTGSGNFNEPSGDWRNGKWSGDRGSLDDGLLVTTQIYGQIVQDWGTVKVGRMDGIADQGLTSLGYLPSSSGDGYLYRAPFDDLVDFRDAIHYSQTWDNGFGLNAFYAKKEIARLVVASQDTSRYNDADYNEVGVEGVYAWDGGGASLALMWDRDYSGKVDWSGYDGVGRFQAFYVNPALIQSFGDFSVHLEAMLGWGRYYDSPPTLAEPNIRRERATGYAFYGDVDYNYGPGNATLLGWYASGTDTGKMAADSERGDLVGMGDFAPLIVMHYNTSQGDGFWSGNSASDGFNGNGPSNYWGLALTGRHAATDWLTLDWAAGYAARVKTESDNRWVTNNVTRPNEYTYAGKDLGWEVDLGLTLDLLDNLQFSTMFGYLWKGDAYAQAIGYNPNGTPIMGEATDDSHVWLNTLTFSF